MAQIKLNATYGMTGTLPAVSGANLTTLNGTQVTSGTVADARISALTASKLTGALPAISGASLTNLSAGKIGQVVHATYSTETTTTSDSYVTTGLNLAITPTATSSKVLIFLNLACNVLETSDGNIGMHWQLYNTTTSAVIYDSTISSYGSFLRGYSGWNELAWMNAITYLYSPSTTSALTVQAQFKAEESGKSVGVQRELDSQLTLMEVLA